MSLKRGARAKCIHSLKLALSHSLTALFPTALVLTECFAAVKSRPLISQAATFPTSQMQRSPPHCTHNQKRDATLSRLVSGHDWPVIYPGPRSDASRSHLQFSIPFGSDSTIIAFDPQAHYTQKPLGSSMLRFSASATHHVY